MLDRPDNYWQMREKAPAWPPKRPDDEEEPSNVVTLNGEPVPRDVLPSPAEAEDEPDLAPWQPNIDDETGLPVYEAIRSVNGRRAASAWFYLTGGEEANAPWISYGFALKNASKTGMVLIWPLCRFEITGANLGLMNRYIQEQRAAEFRAYVPGKYAPIADDALRIDTIKLVPSPGAM